MAAPAATATGTVLAVSGGDAPAPTAHCSTAAAGAHAVPVGWAFRRACKVPHPPPPPPPMPDAVAAAAVVAALSARLASVGRVVGWVVGSVGGRDSIGSVESRGAPTKWSLGVVCVEAVAVETRKGRDGECRGATDVRACAAAAAAPWRVHRGVRRGSPACRGGASHGGRGIVGELSTCGGCRRHSHSGFGVCQTQKTRAPAAVARHAR